MKIEIHLNDDVETVITATRTTVFRKVMTAVGVSGSIFKIPVSQILYTKGEK